MSGATDGDLVCVPAALLEQAAALIEAYEADMDWHEWHDKRAFDLSLGADELVEALRAAAGGG